MKFRWNKKFWLFPANILVILFTILMCFWYVKSQNEVKERISKRNFLISVSSMQKVVQNYIDSQQESCDDWATFITSRDHTVTEILAHLSHGNTVQSIMVFLIDYDTLKGRYCDANGVFKTTDFSLLKEELLPLVEEIKAYRKSVPKITKTIPNPVTLMPTIGFCKDVEVVENGATRHYILMRAVPLFLIRQQLVFPTGYEKAELSLLSEKGDYIIRSPSLIQKNFWDFLNTYNPGSEEKILEIQESLSNDESNLSMFKNSESKDVLFACVPADNRDWYFVGAIKKSDLIDSKIDFMLVSFVAAGLIVIMLINFAVFISTILQLATSIEETKRANLAKTSFLSSVSHDIRTPMNAIVGMTALASRRLDDKEATQECLKKITLASHHLLTLINDVLDISQIESGKLSLNPILFSISEALETVTNIAQPLVSEKALDFSVKTEIDHEWLFADEVRVNQIFVNLLTNAVKYTRSGGKVSVSLKEEKIEGDEKNVLLTYIVSDTGIGMSAEFQKTMYETFSRAVDSRIDKIQGTGLGLAITKQMVDIMNGSIECESELRKGTTFTVKIPLQIGEIKDDSEKTSGKDDYSDIAGLKILVAEDNDMNWEITHDLLDCYNIKSQRAINGKVCLEKMQEAKEGDFDIILMDIQMPEMNGKEATIEIRKLESDFAKKIPIIAMTADAFAEDVQACFKAGMNAHIAKPVDLKKLLNALRDVRK